MSLAIAVNNETIEQFCVQHHIRKLALFGSVLRDDFAADSDVDVLVEFHEDHVPGIFGLVGMEEELSAILGHKADMRTPDDLSRYFRDDIVRDALVQYAG